MPCAVSGSSWSSAHDKAGASAGCAMSQVAVLVAQMTLSMPVFALIFYVTNWCFIGVFIISALREACTSAEELYPVCNPPTQHSMQYPFVECARSSCFHTGYLRLRC